MVHSCSYSFLSLFTFRYNSWFEIFFFIECSICFSWDWISSNFILLRFLFYWLKSWKKNFLLLFFLFLLRRNDLLLSVRCDFRLFFPFFFVWGPLRWIQLLFQLVFLLFLRVLVISLLFITNLCKNQPNILIYNFTKLSGMSANKSIISLSKTGLTLLSR